MRRNTTFSFFLSFFLSFLSSGSVREIDRYVFIRVLFANHKQLQQVKFLTIFSARKDHLPTILRTMALRQLADEKTSEFIFSNHSITSKIDRKILTSMRIIFSMYLNADEDSAHLI